MHTGHPLASRPKQSAVQSAENGGHPLLFAPALDDVSDDVEDDDVMEAGDDADPLPVLEIKCRVRFLVNVTIMSL